MTQLDRRQLIGSGIAALLAPGFAGCTREDSTKVAQSTVPGTHFENTFRAFDGDVVIQGFADPSASTHLFELSIYKPGTYRFEHASVAKGGSISGLSEPQTYRVTEEKMRATLLPNEPWENGNYMQVTRYTESGEIETAVVCIQYASRNR